MSVAAPAESINLYYKEGSSDKVYQAQLEAKDDGYVVTFQYGRRGSALKAGTKTAKPVAYGAAKEIYTALVKEKMSKGYTPDESGTVYAGSADEQRLTGLVPQLLNPIEESEASVLLKDNGWFGQEKYDGVRLMARMAKGAAPVGSNRKGLSVAMPAETADSLPKLDCVLDGELVSTTFWVFDFVEMNGKDLRTVPARTRWEMLNSLVLGPLVKIAPSAFSKEDKTAMLAKLKADGKEGMVFKKVEAVYAPGRPASGGTALKLKFVESATVEVASVKPGKRSVTVRVYDKGTLVPVGSVTIPANFALPAEGEIVEVRYLYAYKGGSLYQPVYLGPRTDQGIEACRLSQLKFKAETDES